MSEEHEEKHRKAVACYEAAIEHITVPLMQYLLGALKANDTGITYLVDGQDHTTEGFMIPDGSSVGMPFKISMQFGDAKKLDALMTKQKEEFPDSSMKFLGSVGEVKKDN